MPTFNRVVLAIMAHPDDIEFVAAGTMLRLAEVGWELHVFNVSSGDCGSMTMPPDLTGRVREAEGRAAAAIMGATFHESLASDLMIFYDESMVRRVAALVRRVRPRIVLTHSPADYMEDHTNTSRLAVTASFARGMPNFRTDPPQEPCERDITVYHAMPHGLLDGLRCTVTPDAFVDITSVREKKRRALAAHASQKSWLDATQGMDSYLDACDTMSLAVGGMSGRFKHAEGWRRHLHLGFSARDDDPLAEALGEQYCVNPAAKSRS
ncbi:MAG: PIG-L family deacetylase [Planctomycetota bacterium]